MKVKIIDLPKIEDLRGNLTFVESEGHFPFELKRSYWIFDVPSGMNRGGHAFKEQKEVIIALSGSLDVLVNDGMEEKMFSLNRSNKALYVPNGIWREMLNFSTNSLALVLSSTFFSESDYVRDIQVFKKMIDSGEL